MVELFGRWSVPARQPPSLGPEQEHLSSSSPPLVFSVIPFLPTTLQVPFSLARSVTFIAFHCFPMLFDRSCFASSILLSSLFILCFISSLLCVATMSSPSAACYPRSVRVVRVAPRGGCDGAVVASPSGGCLDDPFRSGNDFRTTPFVTRCVIATAVDHTERALVTPAGSTSAVRARAAAAAAVARANRVVSTGVVSHHDRRAVVSINHHRDSVVARGERTAVVPVKPHNSRASVASHSSVSSISSRGKRVLSSTVVTHSEGASVARANLPTERAPDADTASPHVHAPVAPVKPRNGRIPVPSFRPRGEHLSIATVPSLDKYPPISSVATHAKRASASSPTARIDCPPVASVKPCNSRIPIPSSFLRRTPATSIIAHPRRAWTASIVPSPEKLSIAPASDCPQRVSTASIISGINNDTPVPVDRSAKPTSDSPDGSSVSGVHHPDFASTAPDFPREERCSAISSSISALACQPRMIRSQGMANLGLPIVNTKPKQAGCLPKLTHLREITKLIRPVDEKEVKKTGRPSKIVRLRAFTNLLRPNVDKGTKDVDRPSKTYCLQDPMPTSHRTVLPCSQAMPDSISSSAATDLAPIHCLPKLPRSTAMSNLTSFGKKSSAASIEIPRMVRSRAMPNLLFSASEKASVVPSTDLISLSPVPLSVEPGPAPSSVLPIDSILPTPVLVRPSPIPKVPLETASEPTPMARAVTTPPTEKLIRDAVARALAIVGPRLHLRPSPPAQSNGISPVQRTQAYFERRARILRHQQAQRKHGNSREFSKPELAPLPLIWKPKDDSRPLPLFTAPIKNSPIQVPTCVAPLYKGFRVLSRVSAAAATPTAAISGVRSNIRNCSTGDQIPRGYSIPITRLCPFPTFLRY